MDPAKQHYRHPAEYYTDPENSIGYLARILFRSFSRLLEQGTLTQEVSAGQWRFLRQLWRGDGITQRELSARVSMREPTTVVAVKGLEKAGLITRKKTKDDRRKTFIYLTERGRELELKITGLEASAYPYAVGDDLRQLAEDQAILLALDGISDPQNLGTLLRTAEATGVRLIVIPSDRAAHVTPAVVNASAGAVEHLHVGQEVNLARWLGRAKEAGFWIVGMDDEDAEPLFDTSMRPPVVLVVGSEGSGIRRLVRETCDIIVSLPMMGRIESLNAAVAGSIGLYEIVRDAEED